MASLFWLRADSERSILRAHLDHLSGVFRDSGWRVHRGEAVPTDLGDGGVAILDDPWSEPFPELARALLDAAVPRRRGPAWRVPRVVGGVGKQGWTPPVGTYTLAAYRDAALTASRRTADVPESPWAGFRAAPADEAAELLGRSDPAYRLVPGARLYRYDDPADHERRELLGRVPDDADLVVDVGCGHGRFGALLRRPGRTVVGIEPDPAMAAEATLRLDRVLVGTAEAELPGLVRSAGRVDCVVFADVLEHTTDPASLLRLVRRHLAADGVVVVSVPNLAFAPVLRELNAGRYEPTVAGVQARDHLVPFTRGSLEAMARETGFVVAELDPLAAPLTRRQRWWARWAARSAGGDVADLLAPQWVAVLRPAGD